MPLFSSSLKSVEDKGLKSPGRTKPLINPSVARKHEGGARDFTTIDWVYDLEAHRQYEQQQHRDIVTEFEQSPKRMQGVIWNTIQRLWQSRQDWVAVLLIGVGTGILAGMIHIGVDILQDLKFGMCHEFYWLNQRKCCPGDEEHKCGMWRTWGDFFAGEGIRESQSTTVLDFSMYVIMAVTFGGLSAWMVKTFAPYAAGSGIPEIKTMLSGVHIRRYLGGWTLLIKCVGLCLSVASGLSLGKEGPFVHVACCVGNLTARLFRGFRFHESKKRELISASAAAGVSVAFGAPIGGVLFSLEEASYYFPHKTMWISFFCAVTAALVLKRIDPVGTGRLVLFQVSYNHPWHWFEILPHVFLGVLGGLIGSLFNYLNIRWCRVRKTTSLRHWPVAEAFVVTLVTAVVNYLVPYMRHGATEFLAKLFEDCVESSEHICVGSTHIVVGNLALAATFKLLLTVFTFGIRVPAGLFIPSLFVGACLGRIVGLLVQSFHHKYPDAYYFNECQGLVGGDCVIPGIYAIVGAAAVLGGVTRMTLSLVVIIFELTGGLEYLVPVMFAVLISKWVGESTGVHDSIYEMHIDLNGYPYLDPKAEAPLQSIAADVMVSSNIQVLTVDGWTVRDLNDLLDGCSFNGFPVVMSHSDMRIVGHISRVNLIRALEKGSRHPGDLVNQDTEVIFYERTSQEEPLQLSPHQTSKLPPAQRQGRHTYLDISWYLDPTPICITPDTTVNRMVHLFKSLGLRTCLVSKNNKLVGIVTRRGLIEFLKSQRLGKANKTHLGTNVSTARRQDDDPVPPPRVSSPREDIDDFDTFELAKQPRGTRIRVSVTDANANLAASSSHGAGDPAPPPS